VLQALQAFQNDRDSFPVAHIPNNSAHRSILVGERVVRDKLARIRAPAITEVLGRLAGFCVPPCGGYRPPARFFLPPAGRDSLATGFFALARLSCKAAMMSTTGFLAAGACGLVTAPPSTFCEMACCSRSRY